MKNKTFSQLSAPLLKLTSMFEQFEKRMALIACVLILIRAISPSQHAKGSEILLKSVRRQFSHISPYLSWS